MISAYYLWFRLVGKSKQAKSKNLKIIIKNHKNNQANFELARGPLNLKCYQETAEEYQFLINENVKGPIIAISTFANVDKSIGRIHMGLGFTFDFINSGIEFFSILKSLEI